MWQGWVVLMVGLWLFFGVGLQGASSSNQYLLTGILAFVFGLWVLFQPVKTLPKVLFVIIGIVGLWLGLSSFISGLQATANAIIFGIVLSVLGFWGALTKPTEAS